MATLKAQEDLRLIRALRVGTAKLKQQASAKIIRELERQARRGEPKKPADPTTLRAHGIRVQFVPKGGEIT